jgi:hypothetical protein
MINKNKIYFNKLTDFFVLSSSLFSNVDLSEFSLKY